MHKTYTITVGVIFLIIAALHFARLFYGWPAEIGGLFIPMWASWLAVAVAGFLAIWGFYQLRVRKPQSEDRG